MRTALSMDAMMPAAGTARASSRPAWTSIALLLGAACITFGILWDISWHVSIGRDTFWTPAHMMLYLGGTLGGCVSGWLAFQATILDRAGLRGVTVGVWGARAPLGAWICIWGATAMLTSAPFDDWWHSAYGLDVKILSPPHSLLAVGMYGVVVGASVLVAAERNRSIAAGGAAGGGWIVIAANGIQLALASIMLTEASWPNLQHTGTFAKASSLFYPAFLVAAARYAPVRGSATKVALVYTGVLLSMVWLLPLFPAEPKLAPIQNRIDHMTPPVFPLLLVAPAIAIDLLFFALRKRSARGWDLLRIPAAAALFLGTFLPVQRAFAAFLISPAADNGIFAGGRYFGYLRGNGPRLHQFWDLDRDPLDLRSIVIAGLIALAASAVGLGAGSFLSRVRR